MQHPVNSRQALLDRNRAVAANAGLYIRPRLELDAGPEPLEEQALVLAAEPSVPQQDAAHSIEYVRTTIAYLRTTSGQQGVFQVHKASRPEIFVCPLFINTNA